MPTLSTLIIGSQSHANRQHRVFPDSIPSNSSQSLPPMSQLVFVYGSLKRGYALHWLMKRADFSGPAVTKPLYRIFHLGPYPGLVDWPAGLPVEGELYRVDAECLNQLDQAEGVAEGLYARRDIQLEHLPADHSAQAWFWLGPVAGLPDCGTRWRPDSHQAR